MEFTGERFIPGQGGTIELEHLNRYYFVVHQIDLTGRTVLDIASGEGYGSDILAKYAGKVIGVDISSEAIEHAKNKYQAKNLEFIQGSVVEIPLEDSSVDVVVCFETIEHIDKHDEMMLDIKRVLVKDGFLIISSPDKHFYSDLHNFKNEFHIKELYYEEFISLMKKYFQNTFFYSQRLISGSIIIQNECNNIFKMPILTDITGKSCMFFPVYNLAICTDKKDYISTNQIDVCYETDEVITYADINNAIKNVKNAKPYRLGKFILKPLLTLRRLISYAKSLYNNP